MERQEVAVKTDRPADREDTLNLDSKEARHPCTRKSANMVSPMLGTLILSDNCCFMASHFGAQASGAAFSFPRGAFSFCRSAPLGCFIFQSISHCFMRFRSKRTHQTFSLARLQYWIDTGRIDPKQPINMLTLIRTGCVGNLRRRDQGIKLLSDGANWFKAKGLNIEVTQASKKAVEAIKANGGDVKLVYYVRTGLQALLHPEKYDQEGLPDTPVELRTLPYLPAPPAHVSRRLDQKPAQPAQFAGWIKRQQKLVAKAQAAGEAVPEASQQLIEKFAADLKA